MTIAIPTKNRAHLLTKAIASAVAQTYPHIEVVVSDNASNDATPDVLRSISSDRVRAITQAQGVDMVSNWNACLDAAKGVYFVLLSDDDYLEHNFVSELVVAFDEPKVAFSWCAPWLHDDLTNESVAPSKFPEKETGKEFARELLLHRRDVFPSAVLVRTADLRRIGGYSANFPARCDTAVWLNLALEPGAIVRNVPGGLAHYNAHQASVSVPADKPEVVEEMRVVDMAATMARRNGFPAREIAGFARLGRCFVARKTASQALRLRQQGFSRREIARFCWKRRMLLSSLSCSGWVALGLTIVVAPKTATSIRRAFRWGKERWRKVVWQYKSKRVATGPVSPACG